VEVVSATSDDVTSAERAVRSPALHSLRTELTGTASATTTAADSNARDQPPGTRSSQPTARGQAQLATLAAATAANGSRAITYGCGRYPRRTPTAMNETRARAGGRNRRANRAMGAASAPAASSHGSTASQLATSRCDALDASNALPVELRPMSWNFSASKRLT